MTQAPNPGGRPPTLALEDIATTGRAIGMADLSLSAVATRLEVTPAALYRHVKNRWDLERLVGESMLEELVIDLEATADVSATLHRLALDLHRFAIDRPGLADYLLTLFPRGERGLTLMNEATQKLREHGLSSEAAVIASNSVASLAFAMAAGQERRSRALERDADGGFAAEVLAATARFDADDELGPAVTDLPSMTESEYARMLLVVAVRGVVATIGQDPGAADATAIVTELLVQARAASTDPTRS